MCRAMTQLKPVLDLFQQMAETMGHMSCSSSLSLSLSFSFFYRPSKPATPQSPRLTAQASFPLIENLHDAFLQLPAPCSSNRSFFPMLPWSVSRFALSSLESRGLARLRWHSHEPHPRKRRRHACSVDRPHRGPFCCPSHC